MQEQFENWVRNFFNCDATSSRERRKRKSLECIHEKKLTSRREHVKRVENCWQIADVHCKILSMTNCDLHFNRGNFFLLTLIFTFFVARLRDVWGE